MNRRAHARIECAQDNPKQALDSRCIALPAVDHHPPTLKYKRPGLAGAPAYGQHHTDIHPASVVSSAFRHRGRYLEQRGRFFVADAHRSELTGPVDPRTAALLDHTQRGAIAGNRNGACRIE